MRLWRISNYKDLSGLGGLKAAGRWHAKGRHVVYATDHPASALLEVMVHLEIDFEDLPRDYQLLEIELPDDIAVENVLATDIERISNAWQDKPPVTRGLLAPWFDSARTAVAMVPSAIMPFSSNYLINPLHPDASRIKVVRATRHPYDRRLFAATSR
jgi:RES domain-containing protein